MTRNERNRLALRAFLCFMIIQMFIVIIMMSLVLIYAFVVWDISVFKELLSRGSTWRLVFVVGGAVTAAYLTHHDEWKRDNFTRPEK